jgi:hypothetical protein
MDNQDGAARVRGVPVASFASRPLAELARCFLEDNGVDALVDADDGNGTQPEVGFVTGGARVLVAPSQRDHARSLLDEVEREIALHGDRHLREQILGPLTHIE